MRNIRQSGKLLWAVSLGFAAGAILVAAVPWLRISTLLEQTDALLREPNDASANGPAGSELAVTESPVSLPQEPNAVLVDSPSWAEQGRECVKVITARNIFLRGQAAAAKMKDPSQSDKDKAGGLTESQAQAKLPFPFRLLGTVASDAATSYAVLEAAETKAQDIYRVGQAIGDARLERIEQNRVVVLRNGSRKTLELVLTGQPATPAPAVEVAAAPPAIPSGPEALLRVAGGGDRQINMAASSSQVSQATQSFLSRIKLSPSIVDGNSVGLRISGLGDSLMAQVVGLKDGDVIQSVNGHPVTSQTKAVQVLSKARKLGTAELGFQRDQEKKSLAFRTSAW